MSYSILGHSPKKLLGYKNIEQTKQYNLTNILRTELINHLVLFVKNFLV